MLVVKHDIKEGTMHVEAAIPAQPTFIINEPQLAHMSAIVRNGIFIVSSVGIAARRINLAEAEHGGHVP